jgi:hypothetical protein
MPELVNRRATKKRAKMIREVRPSIQFLSARVANFVQVCGHCEFGTTAARPSYFCNSATIRS